MFCQSGCIFLRYIKIKYHIIFFRRLIVATAFCCLPLFRSDPGVVRYLGHFEDQYMTFIIMEYCCQGDLFRTVFLKGGSVDEAWAVTQVVAPLLQVLTRLHARNILHRYTPSPLASCAMCSTRCVCFALKNK
jgi:serine/threonine protein kinase